jgi:hypothetical protein
MNLNPKIKFQGMINKNDMLDLIPKIVEPGECLAAY